MSKRYEPTEEQATTSALCAALAAHCVTEREAIEALFRQAEEYHRIATRLAAFQPMGAIVFAGKAYTNPTADRLAVEGHARTMAAILAEERAKGRAEAVALAELAMCVDTRMLPPAKWKALRDAAEAVLAGRPTTEQR